MPPRNRSPAARQQAYYPAADIATFKDLLLFEERLKRNAGALKKRKLRYQRACILIRSHTILQKYLKHSPSLIQSIPIISLGRLRIYSFSGDRLTFYLATIPVHLTLLVLMVLVLLSDVLLETELFILPLNLALSYYFLYMSRWRGEVNREFPPFTTQPYIKNGSLFISGMTLFLFFASGMYREKVEYANKCVQLHIWSSIVMIMTIVISTNRLTRVLDMFHMPTGPCDSLICTSTSELNRFLLA
jgi:hypothetical protein